MGRANTPQQARLVEEARHELFFVGQHLVQYLDRHEGLQLLVPGANDDGEAAAAYFIANLVATDIGWQLHARVDPLQVIAGIDTMIKGGIQNVVIPVCRGNANGDGAITNAGRCGTRGGVVRIIVVPVPFSLLHPERLGIYANLLDVKVVRPTRHGDGFSKHRA